MSPSRAYDSEHGQRTADEDPKGYRSGITVRWRERANEANTKKAPSQTTEGHNHTWSHPVGPRETILAEIDGRERLKLIHVGAVCSNCRPRPIHVPRDALMTRILRAVLKDDAIEVYVYSPDDILNAEVGKKVAHILGPEAATLFWRLRELDEGTIRSDDEVNLIQVAVDDEGLIAVEACTSLSESTVTEVVETGMRVLDGDEAVHEFRGDTRPVGPTVH